MNVYYARSQNEDGEKETVEHHLQRAGELCGGFLEPIGYRDWGMTLGETHDFGKFSPLFAEVLEHQRIHVNHAMPGAALIYFLYNKKSVTRTLLGTVIAAHHSSLSFLTSDKMKRLWTGQGQRFDENGYTYSLYGKEELKQAYQVWSGTFKRRSLRPAPKFNKDNDEDPLLLKMLFIRMLYSALIDADYCSSAEHFDPDYLTHSTGRLFDPDEALNKLHIILQKKRTESTAAKTLNTLRDELFENCISAARGNPGLYTLTAPTGLGKTLSLFAFAAEHCRLHEKRRVILVLPYLSLLEQNVKDYRELVPDLLEIHSNISCDERARLLCTRWAAPCIVTTNIGLLEPLFAAEPSSCRHLHQLSNSVIVLDEAQSLPTDLLYATLRTLKELCNRYGCTVVLSTATQPSYEFLKGLQWKPTEIAMDPDRLFAQTRRVQYEWRLDKPESLDQISEELYSFRQACVIVNLRRHARKVYRNLKQAGECEGLFYMTTDLCPAHRMDLLEEIKLCLKKGTDCRLIATQCIEAGVDLDFPVLYRALAPLDSIIQAAGRCNRNGKTKNGKVVVFYPEDERSIYPPGEYYEMGANCVLELAQRHPIDCSNREHIREYYELLYSRTEGDRQSLRQAVDAEDFARVEKEYFLINQNGVNVIVPYRERQELFEEIRLELDEKRLTDKMMYQLIQKARPITVTTYDRRSAEMYCQQLYVCSAEYSGELIPTGYFLLGDATMYDESTGLCWPTSEEVLFG